MTEIFILQFSTNSIYNEYSTMRYGVDDNDEMNVSSAAMRMMSTFDKQQQQHTKISFKLILIKIKATLYQIHINISECA